MSNTNVKKKKQLGMPIGTASNRLRKSIIFNLLKKTNENFCHQCKLEISSEKELSIEHKVPYLDSEDSVRLFFDLDNIGFSHLSCNVRAGRKKLCDHGSARKYLQGCRCDLCTEANTIKVRKFRSKL